MDFEIQGLDDCLRWMDNLPGNCIKVSKAAMRDASRTVSKKMRARAPKRWRRLIKYAVDKNVDGTLSAWIGLFNGHQHQGHQRNGKKPIDDWFKAYWANYGTLTHRDQNHTFKYGIKNKKRRNDVGQRPMNFFEAAANGAESEFIDAFNKALAEKERDFYDR